MKVTMHSFLEDGEFVKNDFCEKVVIHVMFQHKNVIKAMGCI